MGLRRRIKNKIKSIFFNSKGDEDKRNTGNPPSNVMYETPSSPIQSKESESIEYVFDQDEINLQAYFNSRYPQLQGLNYKTAVNQEIKSSIDKNSGTFEIALLPPFAGG